MNLYNYFIQTENEGLYNITKMVTESVSKSNIKDGVCLVYCPHTTAGITINENADKDVVSDILLGLKHAFPENKNFKHFEGNSTAHLKSSFVGCEKLVIIENGKLKLGTWQGIFFCEFDGPRKREFYVKII